MTETKSVTETRLRVAAAQMVSAATVEPNLRAAEELIAQAAAAGAQLVALPEYFCLMGRKETDKVAAREADGHGPIQDFLARQAERQHIWLVGGTVPLIASEAAHVMNSALVFSPSGQRVARYDKVHLFAFQQGEESYEEARTIAPGAQVITFELAAPGGPTLKIGLSVCYDLRFPELYRAMGQPDLILIPSAFTETTGRAHWDTLVKARAIENLCYVLAPAQGGRHENGRETYGHSLLVDPLGRVVDKRAEGAGIVIGDVDLTVIAECRERLPALKHRVF